MGDSGRNLLSGTLTQQCVVSSYLVFGTLAFAVGAIAGLGFPTAVALFGGILLIALLLNNAILGSSLVVLATLVIGAIEPPRIGGVTLVNICLGACLFVLTLHHAMRSSRSIKWPTWSLLLCVVILASPTNPSTLSGLSTPLLTAAVIYLLAKRNKISILWILGLAGIFHAGIGLFESMSHTSLVYTAWKDQSAADVGGIRRAASTIGDPNYLGVTLICTAPGVAFIARQWHHLLRLATWTLVIGAFIFTFSRGAFLGALIAACFYACLKYSTLLRPARIFAILLGLVTLAATLVTSPLGQPLIDRFTNVDASTRSRSILQTATLELFQEHWLTGLGFGNLQSHLAPLAHALVPLNASGVSAFLPQTDPLNTYLLVGAEGGILALMLVLYAVFLVVARTIRVAPALASAVVGVATSAATLDLLRSPVIWCFMVLALHLHHKGQDHRLQVSVRGLNSPRIPETERIMRAKRQRLYKEANERSGPVKRGNGSLV